MEDTSLYPNWNIILATRWIERLRNKKRMALVISQLSMRRLCTSRKITHNSHRLQTPIDAGFCPFCNYHSSCHKTLNNHVRIHLSLSLFCGFKGCFFATSDCKALIQHTVMEHLCYEKSKELHPQKRGSG